MSSYFCHKCLYLRVPVLTLTGYSGAEVVRICQAAADRVLKQCKQTGEELQLHMVDFEEAIATMKMQITPEMVQAYERWASGARGDTD